MKTHDNVAIEFKDAEVLDIVGENIYIYKDGQPYFFEWVDIKSFAAFKTKPRGKNNAH